MTEVSISFPEKAIKTSLPSVPAAKTNGYFGKKLTKIAGRTSNGSKRGYAGSTGKLKPRLFLLQPDGTGPCEGGFFPVLGNGHRGLPLLALVGHPADLIAIQFIVETNPNHTSAGIADRNHVLVGTDLTELLLGFVTPGYG